MHGTYARTAGGDPRTGVFALNGSPSEIMWKNTQLSSEQAQMDDQFNRMFAAFNAGGMLITGTPCGNGGDDTQNSQGLINCHAYPIIDMAEAPGLERIIKIRNPWHIERYFGDYSDLA